ncbi:hypothetical protein PanWU01x14_268340, partial [Parasponia andersonii]
MYGLFHKATTVIKGTSTATPIRQTNKQLGSFDNLAYKKKGWDVLLKSYLEVFYGVDGVALYLLTNPYYSDGNFRNKTVEFVENSDSEKPVTSWAPNHSNVNLYTSLFQNIVTNMQPARKVQM